MPNSIFFPQKGAKNSQFAADYQSENFKYKNWICNAQIPNEKIRGSVVVNQKKCWFSVYFLNLSSSFSF